MGLQVCRTSEGGYSQLLNDVQQVNLLVQLVLCLFEQTRLQLFLFVAVIEAAAEDLTTKTLGV
jgi:hypothetical protein